ncbi:hypothetical protein FRC09_014412 [Ceratobasidium sp. 395]|nr:hypothetical protein FRC09_014412 [Ceratobasidium sp. 395]
MHAFTRVVAFVFVLLSLSFLVSALPALPRTFGSICLPNGTDKVSATVAKFAAEIEVKINVLLGCGTKAELIAAIDALIACIKVYIGALDKVGAGIAITVEAKASIVASVVSIISLLVKVLAQVTVKFGLVVVLSLFAKIDICLKELLVALNVCVDGILPLIAKALALVVGLLGQVHFGLCLDLLDLNLGINPGLGIHL